MKGLVGEERNEGYKWILVLIDMFTKQLNVYPLFNKTADEIMRSLKDLLIRRKYPVSVFLSDREL